VAGNLLGYREYQSLVAERSRSGERLQELVTGLEELKTRSEELGLSMNKIFLAYGLSAVESSGQGGYPFAAEPPPESIYAGAIERGNALTAGVSEQLQVLETFLHEVRDFEQAHRDQALSTPSICPLRGDDFVLTSPFGNRRSPFTKAIAFHAGIDLAAPTGSPIYAPADGLVVFAGRYPLRRSVGWWRYGNLVVLRHSDRFISVFGHCHEVKVRRGQRVRQGDLLALVGNSGWSTNPHLHYEVRRKGEDAVFRPVDPRIYILDHRWRDQERLLVRARRAPDLTDFEPLPKLITR
jgi:murein DD-endopeptidase MepM/ murein hydrolase activator NlpD